MTLFIDETHDASLTSWVESANAADTDFPLQNLPFGVFRYGNTEQRRVGIAIGDVILDLDACAKADLFPSFDPALRTACQSYTLNTLCALGPSDAAHVRRVVSRLLRSDTAEGKAAMARRDDLLRPMSGCVLTLPAEIGDYTDFYASINHATNVGAMFRPDSPLLPNYKWLPVGYHGRASSIVASGTPVRRPHGQARPDANAPPVFRPTRSLDYELEMGALIGAGNPLGTPVPLAQAEGQLFGLCLMNDWSARDIQSWEYQPLGPFLSKNFATSMSPWIVTLGALAPFRVARASRPAADPEPLAHLDDPRDRELGAFDITLEVLIRTGRMRMAGLEPERVSSGAFREMYWTFAQLVAHHSSNGCNLRPGDLIGSGTVSGAAADARGCLLELTSRGENPIVLAAGDMRGFLEDGDEVVFRGWCERPGYRRIGFGECRGEVTPAVSF